MSHQPLALGELQAVPRLAGWTQIQEGTREVWVARGRALTWKDLEKRLTDVLPPDMLRMLIRHYERNPR